ncbi:hypothetical protein COB55_06030 [Candidatus Wolfebacteria bacterium]|nr:MAG: hypothetical protein COB55_06030 [Candidatus Wolfebacteria bacterium]
MKSSLTLQEQINRIKLLSIDKQELNENIIIDKGFMSFPMDEMKIKPFLIKLKNRVGRDKYDSMVSNQQERDDNRYHITILNHIEIRKLEKQIETPQIKTEPKLLGLGVVNEGFEQSYYVIVDFPEVNDYRQWLGLDKKDLHITLGYTNKGIMNVKKDKSTLIN